MRSTIAHIAALMLLNGCAYHRLVAPEAASGDQFYHPVKTSAIGWGAIEEQRVADRCSASHALSEVRVKTSFVQSLATVLTLGFWQPARIEYRCAKPTTPVGEITP